MASVCRRPPMRLVLTSCATSSASSRASASVRPGSASTKCRRCTRKARSSAASAARCGGHAPHQILAALGSEEVAAVPKCWSRRKTMLRGRCRRVPPACRRRASLRSRARWRGRSCRPCARAGGAVAPAAAALSPPPIHRPPARAFWPRQPMRLPPRDGVGDREHDQQQQSRGQKDEPLASRRPGQLAHRQKRYGAQQPALGAARERQRAARAAPVGDGERVGDSSPRTSAICTEYRPTRRPSAPPGRRGPVAKRQGREATTEKKRVRKRPRRTAGLRRLRGGRLNLASAESCGA